MYKWAWLLNRGGFMAPADDDGSDLGGTGTEGDDKAASAEGDAKDAGTEGDAKDAKDAGAEGDAKDTGEEGDAKDTGEEGDKDYHVPKARLDAATRRANRERERADAAEAALAAKGAGAGDNGKGEDKGASSNELETRLDTLEDQLDAAIKDGDNKEARRVRTEMRGVEREITNAMIREQTTVAISTARHASSADQLLATYENQFPVINPDSEAYDADVDSEVAELKSAFEAKGTPPAEALSKAVSYVLGAAPAKTSARKTDITKNLDAHTRQPGKMGGKDNGSNGMSKGINPMQLTEAEFDKLTDEQLANLRGDTVTG